MFKNNNQRAAVMIAEKKKQQGTGIPSPATPSPAMPAMGKGLGGLGSLGSMPKVGKGGPFPGAGMFARGGVVPPKKIKHGSSFTPPPVAPPPMGMNTSQSMPGTGDMGGMGAGMADGGAADYGVQHPNPLELYMRQRLGNAEDKIGTGSLATAITAPAALGVGLINPAAGAAMSLIPIAAAGTAIEGARERPMFQRGTKMWSNSPLSGRPEMAAGGSAGAGTAIHRRAIARAMGQPMADGGALTVPYDDTVVTSVPPTKAQIKRAHMEDAPRGPDVDAPATNDPIYSPMGDTYMGDNSGLGVRRGMENVAQILVEATGVPSMVNGAGEVAEGVGNGDGKQVLRGAGQFAMGAIPWTRPEAAISRALNAARANPVKAGAVLSAPVLATPTEAADPSLGVTLPPRPPRVEPSYRNPDEIARELKSLTPSSLKDRQQKMREAGLDVQVDGKIGNETIAQAVEFDRKQAKAAADAANAAADAAYMTQIGQLQKTAAENQDALQRTKSARPFNERNQWWSDYVEPASYFAAATIPALMRYRMGRAEFGGANAAARGVDDAVQGFEKSPSALRANVAGQSAKDYDAAKAAYDAGNKPKSVWDALTSASIYIPDKSLAAGALPMIASGIPLGLDSTMPDGTEAKQRAMEELTGERLGKRFIGKGLAGLGLANFGGATGSVLAKAQGMPTPVGANLATARTLGSMADNPDALIAATAPLSPPARGVRQVFGDFFQGSPELRAARQQQDIDAALAQARGQGKLEGVQSRNEFKRAQNDANASMTRQNASMTRQDAARLQLLADARAQAERDALAGMTAKDAAAYRQKLLGIDQPPPVPPQRQLPPPEAPPNPPTLPPPSRTPSNIDDQMAAVQKALQTLPPERQRQIGQLRNDLMERRNNGDISPDDYYRAKRSLDDAVVAEAKGTLGRAMGGSVDPVDRALNIARKTATDHHSHRQNRFASGGRVGRFRKGWK